MAVRSVSVLSLAKPSAIPRNVPDQTRAGCDQKANQEFQGLYINASHLRLELHRERPPTFYRAASLSFLLLAALFYRVFDVTGDLVRGAFSFVDLTFRL